jgi:Kef-type K+ transport system membrane component KefB/nucleotide-binding universal stress UspA family protein
MAVEHTVTIFVAQLILLLLVGRCLGELLSRIGQPAIFGQLLAGVLLGPSVFGALAPGLRELLFPGTPALKSMIDALSQVGILLLLLLTGMETNLALVKQRRRAVVSTSLSGIVVPFACGIGLTYFLPAWILPIPEARLVTALFIGTALSISSVKIVAMVLMEIGAIRRDLGQLILATAILDDTAAWIIIAVISGIAAHGAVDVVGVGGSLVGTVVFLGVSFTFGRRLVARAIRWTNDTMTIEVPVITAILVIMLVMALITDLIGVHTALGAFIAGILIGQSPILTEHIEDALRGFIMAFFSPIFFAVAGLGMDIRSLGDPTILGFTFAMIGIATLGKFAGALTGGRLGGLTGPESLALATGLNARGSTEVIIASIGLSMGVLGERLYTMIVAMAVVTTMIMPPTLRWVMSRVPLREEEARRLEREEAEERQDVPGMERVLLLVEDSPNAHLAAHLAGVFAGHQGVAVTVMLLGEKDRHPATDYAGLVLQAALTMKRPGGHATDVAAVPSIPVKELIQAKGVIASDEFEAELGKGYDLIVAGLQRPLSEAQNRFEPRLQRLVNLFDGPVAIILNGAAWKNSTAFPHMRVLVPTGGTPHARLATEVALTLARATAGRVTALHVFDRQADTEILRGRARRLGMSVLADVRRSGRRMGVEVEPMTAVHPRPEVAIRRSVQRGTYDLLVIGAALRLGENKLLGPRSTALLSNMKQTALLIVR